MFSPGRGLNWPGVSKESGVAPLTDVHMCENYALALAKISCWILSATVRQSGHVIVLGANCCCFCCCQRCCCCCFIVQLNRWIGVRLWHHMCVNTGDTSVAVSHRNGFHFDIIWIASSWIFWAVIMIISSMLTSFGIINHLACHLLSAKPLPKTFALTYVDLITRSQERHVSANLKQNNTIQP